MNDAERSVIELEGVTKSYRLYRSNRDRLKEALSPFGRSYHKPFVALKDIDLAVRPGEILGIVGGNGAGKSTLLKIISGVLTPTTGAVRVEGEVAALLELGSGLNPQYSGLENILFYGAIMGHSKQEMQDLAPGIIEFAGLGEFIDQPLKLYSSGMRARLAFAINTSIDPDILIVDEVLAVGDAAFKRKSYSRMESLLSAGKSVLFVSHSLSQVTDLCTRAILLDHGEIISCGSPKDVTRQYEQLVFAHEDESRSLRRSLLESYRAHRQPGRSSERVAAASIEAAGAAAERESPEHSYFLAKLDSVPEHYYSDAPAVRLSDFRIETPDGQRVNVLKHNDAFVLRFQARFAQAARQPSFDIAFRNSKGIKLSQASSARFLPTQDVTQGEAFDVSWSFECYLNPGHYFVNVAVLSLAQESAPLLQKVVDACMFRVFSSGEDRVSGLVDLKQEPRVIPVQHEG